jgi:hypothetical protein
VGCSAGASVSVERVLKRALSGREAHSRSLHCAPPDFLLNFVNLAKFLRLSEKKRTLTGIALHGAGNDFKGRARL